MMVPIIIVQINSRARNKLAILNGHAYIYMMYIWRCVYGYIFMSNIQLPGTLYTPAMCAQRFQRIPFHITRNIYATAMSAFRRAACNKHLTRTKYGEP